MNYKGAKNYILDRLKKELSDDLYYHGLHHTLDVLRVTEQLCQEENIPQHEQTLLKTAALYHDSGFIKSNKNHEMHGCEIARDSLPQFGYTDKDIKRICGMIMATRIPQSPQNKLEQILCDADLDYLGRNDFFEIGGTLFQELKAYNVLQTEEAWNRLQLTFLEAHNFFTLTSKKKRETKKTEHLEKIRGIVQTYS